ncbi:MAG: hypothetical protein AAF629_10215 [Chloroflexota bacterium]
MNHSILKFLVVLFLIFVSLTGPVQFASGQEVNALAACEDLAFSTEEDFVTQGPLPPDGNAIISDGDLLGKNHAVCARNQMLLAHWGTLPDLGLDAVDVLDTEKGIVLFSTELNDPEDRFTNGDLLSLTGIVIPNSALLIQFDLAMDLGLDALHMTGDSAAIAGFLNDVQQIPRETWLAQPTLLTDYLTEYSIDIWFSTEATAPDKSVVPFLDGDLLSARTGTVVMSQDQMLSVPIPAGLPNRGVDFGLDGVTSTRSEEPDNILFSTEILFREALAFTDGDILMLGGTIVTPHHDLVNPFEPAADFLGIDAFFQAQDGSDTSEPETPDLPNQGLGEHQTFLPIVTKK